MLPNTYDHPTATAKHSCHNLITATVSFDLGSPELVVAGRRLAAARTTVPEATIHKNGDSLFWKDEIRPSK
jgi:hypothetical protein